MRQGRDSTNDGHIDPWAPILGPIGWNFVGPGGSEGDAAWLVRRGAPFRRAKRGAALQARRQRVPRRRRRAA